MDDSRESTLKKNDVIDSACSSSYVEGCKDLGVYTLENTQVSKCSRYLHPDTKTWSMGPLNAHVYKHNFVTLPEEIVLNIFKKMDKRTLVTCTRVCHQWRRIAYDVSLWQQLNIYHRSMNILTLHHLLARNIKYFSASHSNFCILENQYICKTPFPKLQYLDLSFVSMDYTALRSLLRQCSNLIKLSLENGFVDSLCCQYIGQNTNLKVLNLASIGGLDRIGLEHIMSLQNLEELNVACAKLEYDNLHYLMANMIQNIKCLDIRGFWDRLEDFDFSIMGSRCTKLIKLDISDNINITASSLDKILEKNHKLEVLTMNRCHGIVTPRLLSLREFNRRKRISIMSLSKVNLLGMSADQIFGDEIIIHGTDNYLGLEITNNIFGSDIAKPKLAFDYHTIWEIRAFIDSGIHFRTNVPLSLFYWH